MSNALCKIAMLLLVLAFPLGAQAQHNHAAGHNDYQNWASGKTGNCCNNDDCGEIEDAEWRESADGVHVAIEGQWCPVMQEHYITKGKSPNGEKAHACIRKKYDGNNETPCERLLCFTGKPKV